MKRVNRFRFACLCVVLVGCVGEITGLDEEPDAAPSPAPDAGGEAGDAGSPVPSYSVTGSVRDYANGDPLPDVALAVEGLDPGMQAVSDPSGAFTLEGVPGSSAFYFRAMPSGTTYLPTTNASVTVLDANVTADVYVVSAVYRQRQHSTVAIPLAPSTSLVVGELVNLDGTPLTGIPLAAVSIMPAGGGPGVGNGPYFIGGAGDVDPNLLVSTAFGGRARVAFLNVPSGAHMIMVNHAPLDGPRIVAVGSATTYDNGATLARAVHDPTAGQGTPSFKTDVYPILQKASLGGQDCASCHSAGKVAGAVLILDDGADVVHARLLANPLLVNLQVPADSLLLTKPLYESPPNHPNAIWLDATDPHYLKILAWISGGAPL